MKAYKRRSKAQWQQLIDAQQSSGLSQKAFCQQEGLSIGTFTNWKRKLNDDEESFIPSADTGGPSSDPWIELPAGSPGNGHWDIELDLGNGVCLRLSQAS